MFIALLTIGYAMAVLFLEPFYVAAGFAMYLNRRAELEAWDIEQEFRRAFAPGLHAKAALAGAILLAACLPVSAAGRGPAAAGAPPDRAEIARAIDAVKADPNLATERTIEGAVHDPAPAIAETRAQTEAGCARPRLFGSPPHAPLLPRTAAHAKPASARDGNDCTGRQLLNRHGARVWEPMARAEKYARRNHS